MDDRLVLIVEDEPENREVIRITIEEVVGVRAVLAANGEEALAQARDVKPSLVLLDLMIPKLDGFEVARRLKADPATCRTPVIALTALGRPQDRDAALAAGCDDYIDKPFDLDHLVDKVRGYLPSQP